MNLLQVLRFPLFSSRRLCLRQKKRPLPFSMNLLQLLRFPLFSSRRLCLRQFGVYHIPLALAGICRLTSAAAQPDVDSTHTHHLDEILILASNDIRHERQPKPLASVEEYLQTAEKLNLIKRGAYAWEPTVNNMATERISVTIDGMKIFHACTDNMDPVTSYVETANLSRVTVGSGFEASPHAANSIGGSVDLKLKKTGFCCRGWEPSGAVGYETNGNSHVAAADLAYSNETFYLTGGLSRRKSGNYLAGGGEEVLYSPFTKHNFFTNVGVILAGNHTMEGTLIFDRADDVGYPALAMDVKTAQALITSLSYRTGRWETKAYFNTVTHVMDDSRRPDVPILMDMPGFTRTAGFYSLFDGEHGLHHYTVNLEGYFNRSSAWMVMYPTDPNEKEMFMSTWPDIRTFHAGLFASEEYRLALRHSLLFSGRLSLQRDGIANEDGVKTLSIYHPHFRSQTNRLSGNLAGRYCFHTPQFELMASAGYGSRPPTVSEAYGYFLFNTFDAYDYIGNPYLRHEASLETSLSAQWTPLSALLVRLETSHFYFTDYIIGRPEAELSAMTIGSRGVKVYQNLPHAALLNSSFSLDYRFPRYLTLHTRLSHCYAHDDHNAPLPLIPPLTGEASLGFRFADFSATASFSAAAHRTRYAETYGEDATPPYLVTALSAGYDFHLSRCRNATLTLRTGIENLFDIRYSTYADWNNLPRKGRSLFLHLAFTP
jgi:iron complex outermembrane receptor protein